MESILIDDFGPLPVRRPTSVAELCGLVKEAADGGQGVYPVGGRTTLDVGLPPIKSGFALDTTALNQVIDYPARDMTITVQAGITMAKLQATLAAEGQWLPIDVPNPEQSTIGGAVALNKSGPRRYGYGTLRDYVIGISFATDEGNEVKAGGRVVKNVAGYDLMKLQVGAVGTLGVVTQLTLKVKPKPEAPVFLTFDCEMDNLARVLDTVHASKSRACAVEIVTNAKEPGRKFWWVGFGFEEKKTTVDWQKATILKELSEAGVKQVGEFTGPEGMGLVNEFYGFFPTGDIAPFVWKACLLPSRTASFCNAAALIRARMQVVSHALNGIVSGSLSDDLTNGDATTMVSRLADLAASGGGSLTIVRCPTAWKKSLPVWGKPGSDRELMRHVKQTLDPKNVFNPGRLFGDV